MAIRLTRPSPPPPAEQWRLHCSAWAGVLRLSAEGASPLQAERAVVEYGAAWAMDRAADHWCRGEHCLGQVWMWAAEAQLTASVIPVPWQQEETARPPGRPAVREDEGNDEHVIEFREPRPLRNGPGRALAMEMVNRSGKDAYALAVAALDGLAHAAAPQRGDSERRVEALLTGYLRGLAAAAIVADAATGKREWTGAGEFALHGNQVDFMPPDSVLLGTLSLAVTAVRRAWVTIPAWEAVLPGRGPGQSSGVPFDHVEIVVAIRNTLVQAAHERMVQVGERAREVGGD